MDCSKHSVGLENSDGSAMTIFSLDGKNGIIEIRNPESIPMTFNG